jgi:hypothetical protein
MEQSVCQQYVPGRARNVRVNVRLEGLSSRPILLPVWVMAYKYRETVYRFLVNGQTGRATGHAPVSWKKMIIVTAIAVAVLLVILLGIAGALAS